MNGRVRAMSGVGALVCLFMLLRCDVASLDKHVEYASFAEAKADGAITRGWIPSFVPESAHDIRESHNLDTNEQWIRFDFALDDRPALERLDPIETDEVEFPRTVPTKSREWWPSDLQNEGAIDTNAYSFFRFGSTTGNSLGYLAIESDFPRAWIWRL